MRKFDLADYCIATVRDGQSTYKKDEAINNMDINDVLIVYKDDVWSYYYAVPLNLEKKAGEKLLEFFYSDNYDYSDEKLQDFKSLYPNIFKAI